jgi:hypothetical protein
MTFPLHAIEFSRSIRAAPWAKNVWMYDCWHNFLLRIGQLI